MMFSESEWQLSRESVEEIHRHTNITEVSLVASQLTISEPNLYIIFRFQFTMDVMTIDLFTGGTQFVS